MRKRMNDETMNRRKVIMYGCAYTKDDGTFAVDNIKTTRTEAVKASKHLTPPRQTIGICKVEMLVPSEKNQWTITMEEHVKVKKTTLPILTRKFTIETKKRPIVWGTKKLTDEAVQAYIDTYIGNDPDEIKKFKEGNGTTNLFMSARSQQIN